MSLQPATECFGLSFPGDLTVEQVLGVTRSLSTRQRRGFLRRADPLVFEVRANRDRLEWLVVTSVREADLVIGLLRGSVPGLSVDPVEIGPLRPPTAARELRLAGRGRELRGDVSEVMAHAVLRAMQELAGAEQVVLQWIVGPWVSRQAIPNPPDVHQRPWPQSWFQPPPLDGEATRVLRSKQQEAIFSVVGRIGASAATEARAKQLVRGVFGGLQLARSPGVGLVRRSLPSSVVRRRLAHRIQPWVDWPAPLNADELAAVLAWPIGGPLLRNVRYQSSRRYPADQRVLVDPELAAFTGEIRPNRRHRVIGEATFSGQPGQLVLAPVDALRHLHVIGPTGVGKSTLLANLILGDIATGRGVIVIEPKRDLITDVLARIPADRLDDVVYLDPSDPAFVVGINPLANHTEQDSELVADQLLSVFHGIFRQYWGPRTQDVLHAALLTLAAAPVGDPARTLVALPLLLTDPGLRRRLVPAAAARDPFGVGPFWAWYESISDDQRAQVIGPVLNKLRSVLLRPSLRRTLGASTPAFTLRDVFTKQRILLIDLNRDGLGPEGANLMGALAMASLWQTIQARAAVASEHRRPVFVYLDEFQDYTHLPTDLSDVLAKSRALGVGLVLAHQNLGQLTAELRAAVLANAQNRVTFRLSHDDAAVIARGSNLQVEDLSGLGAWEIYASLMTAGHSTPYASARTLPMTPPVREPGSVRAASLKRFGIPVADVDLQLRRLLGGTNDSSGATVRPDGPIGRRGKPR